VLNDLVKNLRELSFNPGKEFELVTVSFDARETPAMATLKKASYVHDYGRDGAAEGWHFLTGEEGAIQALTTAVGFEYKFDQRFGQFIHASGILVLTPEGKISRFFGDIRPDNGTSARDLKFGLMDATEGRIGSVVDQAQWRCFAYDPSRSRYGFAIMLVLRVGAALTAVGLGGLIFFLWRRERRARQKAVTPG
jgi:protein SCO1/2